MGRALVLAAPTLIGVAQLARGSALVTLAIVFVFSGGAVIQLLRAQTYYAVPGYRLIWVLALATIMIALLRSNLSGQGLVWVAAAVFGAAVLLADQGLTRAKELRIAILGSPIVFVTVNLVLDAVGLVGARAAEYAESQAEILGDLGVTATRQVYPLAQGFADFGVVAGLAVLGSCVLFAGSRTWKSRFALGCAALMSVWALLTVDTRSTIVALALATPLTFAFGRTVGRWFGFVALAIPLSTLVVIVVLAQVGASPIAYGVTRANTETTTASGRTFVWQAVGDHLKQRNPSDLIGYGAFGPDNAGVARQYAVYLPTQTEQRYGSAHNYGLQAIMDVGYLGLVLLLITIAGALSRLALAFRRTGDNTFGALLAFLVLMVVGGAADTTPTIYSPQAFAIWIMIITVSLRPSWLDSLPTQSETHIGTGVARSLQVAM